MEYGVTKEQYRKIKQLAEMKDTVEFMLKQQMGYHKVKDYVEAYNADNIKIVD
ncbi:hypothetical protein [Sporosarcina sp. FSL W7-1283]|uniref:hypothetical protein n=1 Tax=Sporosarcina sp. FSL W7-1283 TaxID=2921560 RepID=UPI0030FA747C